MESSRIRNPITGLGPGENETFYGLPGSEWLDNWTANIDVARNIGIAGPWFFARETYNNGVVSASIQAAQAAITGARVSSRDRIATRSATPSATTGRTGTWPASAPRQRHGPAARRIARR